MPLSYIEWESNSEANIVCCLKDSSMLGWYKNGKQIRSDYFHTIKQERDYSQLSIINNMLDKNGNYMCKVQSQNGIIRDLSIPQIRMGKT